MFKVNFYKFVVLFLFFNKSLFSIEVGYEVLKNRKTGQLTILISDCHKLATRSQNLKQMNDFLDILRLFHSKNIKTTVFLEAPFFMNLNFSEPNAKIQWERLMNNLFNIPLEKDILWENYQLYDLEETPSFMMWDLPLKFLNERNFGSHYLGNINVYNVDPRNFLVITHFILNGDYKNSSLNGVSFRNLFDMKNQINNFFEQLLSNEVFVNERSAAEKFEEIYNAEKSKIDFEFEKLKNVVLSSLNGPFDSANFLDIQICLLKQRVNDFALIYDMLTSQTFMTELFDFFAITNLLQNKNMVQVLIAGRSHCIKLAEYLKRFDWVYLSKMESDVKALRVLHSEKEFKKMDILIDKFNEMLRKLGDKVITYFKKN